MIVKITITTKALKTCVKTLEGIHLCNKRHEMNNHYLIDLCRSMNFESFLFLVSPSHSLKILSMTNGDCSSRIVCCIRGEGYKKLVNYLFIQKKKSKKFIVKG